MVREIGMYKVFLMGLICSSVACGQPNQAPEGFTSLFNGKDLTGWWGMGTENPVDWMALPSEELEAKKSASLKDIKKHWSVKRGALVSDGEGLFLTTDKNYADFELLVEYKTVPKADSGIYLRGIPQVQIWDSTEESKFSIGADKGSGGLWNNTNPAGKNPLVLADKPFGEWNKLRILMVGERVTVYLNDQLVVDHARMENTFTPELPLPRTGPIQLQTHGGKIGWRNLFIREIGSEEASEMLSAKSQQGFESIFDGESFQGWTGNVESYQVVDGTILCKEHAGGFLFTEKEYADFVVKFEFKLPPAGNNGLALRYPGEGNPAYEGMCELQVLDSEAPVYANLDKRQFHGSAYGMVAAHRGYLREVGEWNFQTVEVRGSTIRTELNGTLILDADLSTVTDFMHESAHPGKDRPSGHFGFAGHSDPVAFRNISIKELDHD